MKQHSQLIISHGQLKKKTVFKHWRTETTKLHQDCFQLNGTNTVDMFSKLRQLENNFSKNISYYFVSINKKNTNFTKWRHVIQSPFPNPQQQRRDATSQLPLDWVKARENHVTGIVARYTAVALSLSLPTHTNATTSSIQHTKGLSQQCPPFDLHSGYWLSARVGRLAVY